MVSTATDTAKIKKTGKLKSNRNIEQLRMITNDLLCLGWSGQLYKFRSSIGSKSISWNMKQSQSPSFCDSTKPTFINAARLNSPSVTCSMRNIPYSICCFIRNGWMLAKKIGKCWGLSRYGMIIATRSFAMHSVGLYQPPGSNFRRKWDSMTLMSSRVVFTSMLPTEIEKWIKYFVHAKKK